MTRQVIGVSTDENGLLKVKEAGSPSAPRLSQEEQESRRAMKRLRRRRRSERLSARRRGSTVWLNQAKDATKVRKRKERDGA